MTISRNQPLTIDDMARLDPSTLLFSNLLKCGLCGSNLIIASGGKKTKYVALDTSTEASARTTFTSAKMNWKNGYLVGCEANSWNRTP